MTILTRRARVGVSGAHQREPREDSALLVLGTGTAVLRSITLRTPAEHRHAGRIPPAELQLRFTADEGAQVGIAVPIVPGPASAALDDLERGILDVYGLLARPREFAGYHGTETVPPFLDPMMWLVALTPATAGIAQIDRIVTATADGQRPLPPRALQPSRGRPVVRLRAKVLILRTGSSGAETGELART
ncbi:hypothetical protein DVS28_a0010 [Euzebya pacifica]|uniref:Uncharacterized protein n=1 Tax=Euzebya pacifica TaxID=1608957 RepID=A0A346XR73_9ACTN|nr:hypothetical protein [Euzebya pacifica]AXV04720.1 hypothetical protein DVS28_a0010 [Euzebya pacifica]